MPRRCVAHGLSFCGCLTGEGIGPFCLSLPGPMCGQRELLAEEEDAGEWKGAGDLGAPAKLVGSVEAADCRSTLRQRGIKSMRTGKVPMHLMLVVDNTREH